MKSLKMNLCRPKSIILVLLPAFSLKYPFKQNQEKEGAHILPVTYLYPEMRGRCNPLIRYLIDDPLYYSEYVSYFVEVMEGAFAAATTKARLQAAHDLIAPYVVGENGD